MGSDGRYEMRKTTGTSQKGPRRREIMGTQARMESRDDTAEYARRESCAVTEPYRDGSKVDDLMLLASMDRTNSS